MIAGIVVKSTGFDLVIERLFVSSMEAPKALHERTLFRSRNRETFRFKIRMLLSSDRLIDCFNLAIEVLLISRRTWTLNFLRSPSFNLAIEVLLISSEIR